MTPTGSRRALCPAPTGARTTKRKRSTGHALILASSRHLSGSACPRSRVKARLRKARPQPSDVSPACVLRLCSAVLNQDVTGRHNATLDGSTDRMAWGTTVRSDTGRHPGAGLLIRRSQVRILPGAPQNPRSDGVSEDLGRGPRCVFGRCVLLVCSPVQGGCRWGSTRGAMTVSGQQ